MLECNWQKSERFPAHLISASIDQRLMSVAHMHTHTHTHSCADMNSSHWCDSLWGLLPEWVLCWAGKWWWVNRSTPGLCYTPPPSSTTDTHTHACTPTLLFPCLNIPMSPNFLGPCTTCRHIPTVAPVRFLCVHTLCFSVSTVTPSLLPCLPVLSVMPSPSLTCRTPPNTAWHTISATKQ